MPVVVARRQELPGGRSLTPASPPHPASKCLAAISFPLQLAVLNCSPSTQVPCQSFSFWKFRSQALPLPWSTLFPKPSEKLSLSGQMPESMMPMTMSLPAQPTPWS